MQDSCLFFSADKVHLKFYIPRDSFCRRKRGREKRTSRKKKTSGTEEFSRESDRHFIAANKRIEVKFMPLSARSVKRLIFRDLLDCD